MRRGLDVGLKGECSRIRLYVSNMLMLIGFPPDNRNLDDIRDMIKPFGRLICWQKDGVLARIFIKARVTELTDVPHYIIYSEGDDHEGTSWTVQCEIVQQNLLGGQLRDEDIPPGGFEEGQFIYPGVDNNPDQLPWGNNPPSCSFPLWCTQISQTSISTLQMVLSFRNRLIF